MSRSDWKNWVRNTLLFATPTIISLLTTLQSFITNDNYLPTKAQLIFLAGSTYQALLASAIDWLIKFRADNSGIK